MPAIEDKTLFTSTIRRENTTLNLPRLLNTNNGAVAEQGLPARRKKTTLTGRTNAMQRMTTVGDAFLRPGTVKGRRMRVRWGEGWGRKPKAFHVRQKKKKWWGVRRKKRANAGGREGERWTIFSKKN